MIANLKINVFQVLSRKDPTGTLGLRRSFAADVTRRYKALKRVIWQSVAINDVFAIRERTVQTVLLTLQADTFGTNPLGIREFEFTRSDQKVSRFMDWLQEQESNSTMQVITDPSLPRGREAWSDKYILSAYQQGIADSRRDLIAEGVDIPTFEPTGMGLAAAFNQPIHADRAGLIFTRTFNALKGVDDEMDKQISRVLAKGLVEGRNPNQLAREMNNRIDKIGITRSRLIARTEIVQTHNEATLNEYEVQSVILGEEIFVEWDTAEDENVRASHIDRYGVVYERSEALALIGEPNCRCGLLPYIESIHGPIEKYAKVSEKPPMGSAGKLGECVVKPKVKFKDVMSPAELKSLAHYEKKLKAGKSLTAAQQKKYVKLMEKQKRIETIKPPKVPKIKPEPEVIDITGEFIEAKSIKEAHEDAKRLGLKGNHTYGFVSKSDELNSINKVNEVIFNLQKDFPDIAKAEMLSGIDINTSYARRIKMTSAAGINSDVMGTYRAIDKRIMLAGRLSHKESLYIGGRWNITKSFPGILRHETGHHFYKNMPDDLKIEYNKYYKSKLRKHSNRLIQRGWFSDNVSTYAGTNANEFFAECFAAYTSPLYQASKKKLPKEIEDFFEKIIGKRVLEKEVKKEIKKEVTTRGHINLKGLIRKYKKDPGYAKFLEDSDLIHSDFSIKRYQIYLDFKNAGIDIDAADAKEVMFAIGNYTINGFTDMRKLQYGRKIGGSKSYKKDISRDIEWIEEYLKIAPNFHKEKVIYRGIYRKKDVFEAMNIGDVWDTKAMSSWSSSKKQAMNFLDEGEYKENVMLVLEGGSRRCTSIKYLSDMEGEDEVLLSGINKLQLVSKSYDKEGRLVVKLKDVTPGE